MSAVRGTRTPSPFPRITGFRDRPGTSCGITAKSTRGGIRTRKSLRTHSSGPCLYNHFHAPGQNIKYRRRGSNPQNPASKAGTYSSSVTPAKNTSGGDRTRKRPGFLARRIFHAKRPPARSSPDRRPVMIHEPYIKLICAIVLSEYSRTPK